jgi:hypothetical protein
VEALHNYIHVLQNAHTRSVGLAMATVKLVERRTLVGRWRLIEMELWDEEALDLVGPPFVDFAADGTGEVGFVVVRGILDCRHRNSGDVARVDFTWAGTDDGDLVSGRGWAELDVDQTLRGHIFFQFGDDSSFRATPLSSR